MAKENSFDCHSEDTSDLFTRSGCISDLGFAHYISGALSPPETGRLEAHVAQCPECLEWLGRIIRVIRAEPGEEAAHRTPPALEVERYTRAVNAGVQRSRRKERRKRLFHPLSILTAPPRLAYGAAAALAMAIIFAGLWAWWHRMPARHEQLYAQGVDRLKGVATFETASNLRLLPALVAPRRERRAEEISPGTTGPLDHALTFFFQALGASPNYLPAQIGAGQVYLVKQEPEEARKYFAAARQSDKNNLAACNGLGVALYEMAMIEHDPHKKSEELRAAWDTLAQASALKPGQPEVLYNQVLVSHALGNRSQTLKLIEDYLALDSQSPWAEQLKLIRDGLRLYNYNLLYQEVEQAFNQGRSDRLAALVSASPHAIWLIKKSLRTSIKWEGAGDRPRAQQALAMAEAVENAYRQSTGNENYGRLLDFYRRLSPAEKQQKYHAIAMLEDVYTLYNRGRLEEALKRSTQALRTNRRLDDFWDEAALLHLVGNCYFYHRSDYGRALQAYQAMIRAAERAGDEDAVAEALGNIGVIDQNQGNFSDMQDHLRRMLALAEKVRNPVRQAFALNYLGNLYRELGDWERALPYYSQALALNCRIGNQLGQLENLEHISFLYQRQKEYSQSIGFL